MILRTGLMLALIAALSGLALTLGAVPMRADIVHLRLPRLFLAMAVGASFAVSGLIVQTVLRNPLAEPGVLGVSSGASLAVVCMLMLTGLHGLSVPLAALAGGLATGLVVLRMGRDLILGGVVLGLALNALVMAMIVGFGAGRAELALLWMTGSLYGRGHDVLWPVLGAGALAACLLPFCLRPLEVLRFADDQARGMGLDAGRWRAGLLLLAVALAAAAVAAAGPVGFVGLVVPHLARLLVGARMAHLLVMTPLCGAALTVLADVAGRSVAPPLEIPVGAVTALIGVPVFLLLLARKDPRC